MATHHRVPVGEETIAAVHHDAPSDEWILFCHGFLSDKSGSYERRCQRAVAEGYNAVRFDFRGCGESDGTFPDQTLSSRIADLRAVVDYFDPDSAVLFGSSFGGKVAFHTAAADDWVDAVVTRAPVTYNRAFDDYRDAVDSDGEFRFDNDHRIDDRFFDDFDQYSFDAVADTLDVPVAIVHGGADDTVEVADSFDAAEALSTDVLLQTYETEGHVFSQRASERLLDQTFDWLETQPS